MPASIWQRMEHVILAISNPITLISIFLRSFRVWNAVADLFTRRRRQRRRQSLCGTVSVGHVDELAERDTHVVADAHGHRDDIAHARRVEQRVAVARVAVEQLHRRH